jgi:hypothetical protein
MEMDFGQDQRLGATLALSAGSNWREGPLVRAAFGNFAMLTFERGKIDLMQICDRGH